MKLADLELDPINRKTRKGRVLDGVRRVVRRVGNTPMEVLIAACDRMGIQTAAAVGCRSCAGEEWRTRRLWGGSSRAESPRRPRWPCWPIT